MLRRLISDRQRLDAVDHAELLGRYEISDIPLERNCHDGIFPAHGRAPPYRIQFMEGRSEKKVLHTTQRLKGH